MKIKAAVVREPHGRFSIEELELAAPRADEVLVRLVATGMCHTDLAIVEQLLPLPLPFVLGHEGAGIVVETGPEVTHVAPGDPVVLTFDTCGLCEPCGDHHPAYCDEYALRNFSARRPDGSATIADAAGNAIGAVFFGQSSFATHALTRARNTIKVRADAPLELLGPLGCGITTGAGTVMRVLAPKPRQSLAVLGTGAVGMAALLAAKALGVETIVAIDRVDSRLDLARELGATHCIHTGRQDLAAALAEIGGIDFAVETTGVPVLIATAVNALKEQGSCALLGATSDPKVTLDIIPLISGRVVRGVKHGDCEPELLIPQLIDLFLEGRFPLDRISAFYPFEQINQAVADSTSGRTIKPILTFATTA